MEGHELWVVIGGYDGETGWLGFSFFGLWLMGERGVGGRPGSDL